MNKSIDEIQLDINFSLEKKEMWEAGLMFWRWNENQLNLWVREEENIKKVREKVQNKYNNFLQEIILNVEIMN